MSTIPVSEDVLDPGEPMFDLPKISGMLGIPVTKVHQQLRDGHLIAIRRDGIMVVPRNFFDETGHIVKHLSGLLAVLRDGGYRDSEILRWLFTPDPTLTITSDGSTEPITNGRPVDALHAHQAREVVRRAQAMGY